MIREYFLQQNGFDPIDAYSGVAQQYAMARAILTFQVEAKKAMSAGALLQDVVNVPARTELMRARFAEGYLEKIDGLVENMVAEIAGTVENN